MHSCVHVFIVQPCTEYILCANPSGTCIPLWQTENNYNKVAIATRFKTYFEGNGKSAKDFKSDDRNSQVMIGTDLHFKDCSWSNVEDRFGEGGSVGVGVMMVPK